MTKALLHNTLREISSILVMGGGNSLVYNYLQKSMSDTDPRVRVALSYLKTQ